MLTPDRTPSAATLCATCGDEINGEATQPNPEFPEDATHPECEERYWDAPGEAGLTEESW